MLDPGVGSALFSRVGDYTLATNGGGVKCGVGEEVPARENEVVVGDV